MTAPEETPTPSTAPDRRDTWQSVGAQASPLITRGRDLETFTRTVEQSRNRIHARDVVVSLFVAESVLAALAAREAEVRRQVDEIQELRSSYGELADLAQRLADTPEGSASEDFLTWLDRCTDELRTIIGPMAGNQS